MAVDFANSFNALALQIELDGENTRHGGFCDKFGGKLGDLPAHDARSAEMLANCLERRMQSNAENTLFLVLLLSRVNFGDFSVPVACKHSALLVSWEATESAAEFVAESHEPVLSRLHRVLSAALNTAAEIAKPTAV